MGLFALWAYLQTINICLMGLLTKIYALWAYKTINICLMGLLIKNKNMPYGPIAQE